MQEIVNDINKFRCIKCNKKYSSMSSLCNHNKRYHTINVQKCLLDVQLCSKNVQVNSSDVQICSNNFQNNVNKSLNSSSPKIEEIDC